MLVFGALYRTLHKATDRAVFHRHVAGRPDQIGLLQPPFGHRLVVVLEPEIDPLQFGLVRPFGSTRRKAIELLICCSTKFGKTLRICNVTSSPISLTVSRKRGP